MVVDTTAWLPSSKLERISQNMKKAFLIGDSVRQGYDRYVKAALDGIVDVSYPGGNSMYSVHVLRWLDLYKAENSLPDDLDCIHWNTGLWDTLTLADVGIVTPLCVYKDNIDRICARMKRLFPDAVCIFATTTPCVESRFDRSVCYRLNSDIREYNEAAVRIVKSWGHLVNDLYAKLDGVPAEYYDGPTHPYTREGTKLLADAVARSISDALGTAYKESDTTELFARDFIGM